MADKPQCDTNCSGVEFCREDNKTKLRMWKDYEHIHVSIVNYRH